MQWRVRRLAAAVAVAGVVAVATGCNAGIGIGVGGGLATLLLMLLLAGGSTTAQSGCRVEPCLSPPVDRDATDAGDVRDAGDTGGETLQPCLSPPPPDTGDDTGDVDGGDVSDVPSDGTDGDGGVPDADANGTVDGDAVGSRTPDRQEIVDRLDERLPDDVVDRLADDGEEPA